VAPSVWVFPCVSIYWRTQLIRRANETWYRLFVEMAFICAVLIVEAISLAAFLRLQLRVHPTILGIKNTAPMPIITMATNNSIIVTPFLFMNLTSFSLKISAKRSLKVLYHFISLEIFVNTKNMALVASHLNGVRATLVALYTRSLKPPLPMIPRMSEGLQALPGVLWVTFLFPPLLTPPFHIPPS